MLKTKSQNVERRVSGDRKIWKEAKIVIVDDMETNVGLLTRILSREGYLDIETAHDGTTALELIERVRPDIILLDLHMPQMGGVEVMTEIAHRAAPDAFLPVIVLTADSSPVTRQAVLELGAMDFVVKPFDATEVVLRVRNLLHTRFLHLEMEGIIRARTQSLQEAHAEILERLAQAGEYRDDDTGEHAHRVGALSAAIAELLGLPETVVELLRRAAPLHDVGKIGVSDTILLKPGKLTEAETALMRRHTEVGARILANGRADLVRIAERIALSHHERWDGTGYPNGLEGEEIPLVARIVAVADVYDALSHDRPYRGAWPKDEVMAEIQRGRGSHFDPQVVDAFLDLAAAGGMPNGNGNGRGKGSGVRG